MSIKKKEIQKYIFDPENPTQCKSYKLLLRTAKKEHSIFLSPDFMKEFFRDEIFDDDFKDEFYDLPEDYEKLNVLEKIEIYKKQLSENDLIEFMENKIHNITPDKFTKYSFIHNFCRIHSVSMNTISIHGIDENSVKQAFISDIKSDDSYFLKDYAFDHIAYNSHFIFLVKDFLQILEANIGNSSVIITLEENIDKFLNYNNNNNIKPLFLKKMQDIHLLFNILDNDIRGVNRNIEQKKDFIDKIRISQFYSLKEIELTNLEDKKEIYIVGENGDGKTLLLQSIVIALKGVTKGKVFDLVNNQGDYQTAIEFSDTTILKKEDLKNKDNQYLPLFAYGAIRSNICGKNKDELGFLTLFTNDIDLYNAQDWLTYLDHKEAKKENLIISLEEAKELLKYLLGKEIEIAITTDKVIFKEKGSEVLFEQLSAGYRGVITIICDLIKRFSEIQPDTKDIKEFQGVVLIDEVELHLHPKWKYNFMKKLTDTFPLVQFIVTTHSPTVILGASEKAVFYKVYKQDGEVCISNQIPNEGYTNNSLISSPLFDLESITSRKNIDNDRISDDDYVYDKIHKVISKRLKNNINLSEGDILKMINDEIDSID